MSCNIESLVDEINPSPKQRKKLIKLFSKISIEDYEEYRKYCLPVGLGIPYDNGFAAIDELRNATIVKSYFGDASPSNLVLVKDIYNHLWLKSIYDDHAYDDYRELYIKVDSESHADIVSTRNVNNEEYFFDHPTFDSGERPTNLIYPFLRCNNLSIFCFYTKERVEKIEDAYRRIASTNLLFKEILH